MSTYSKAYQDCARKLNDKIHGLELEVIRLKGLVDEKDKEISRLRKVEGKYAKEKLLGQMTRSEVALFDAMGLVGKDAWQKCLDLLREEGVL